MGFRFNIFLALFFFSGSIDAQSPNFSNDIANIIWEKCSKCHHDGGIANSTLMSYSDVYTLRNDILFRINTNDAHLKMPPWSPDPQYRHYIGERVLSPQEITLISQWINNGAPRGDSTQMPPPPLFGNESVLGTADLSLRIPDYTINAPANAEDFVCFTLPTGISSKKMIRAIEIIPGNRNAVHHVSILKNPNGYPTDTSSHTCMGNGRFISGYVPGSGPVIYPESDTLKMGIPLELNEDLVVNIHYAGGTNGQTDSTRINLFFHDDTLSVREVGILSVSDHGFCIDPNDTDTIAVSFPEEFSHSEPELSLLNINGHAHWIGKEFLIYMADSLDNRTPLLFIPRWLFLWQDFYFFKNPVKFGPGYKIFARAVYDNTADNIFNQHSPPQTVCAGQNSTDEMFSVFSHYVFYEAGDEFIDMESFYGGLTSSEDKFADFGRLFTVFPNPFSGKLNIQFELDRSARVSASVYNMQGQLTETFIPEYRNAGIHFLEWDASQAVPGLYIIQLNIDGQIYSRKAFLK